MNFYPNKLIVNPETKRKIVMYQYMNLDEKDYIPIEDYLIMIDNPSMQFTPKSYIKLVKNYPNEFQDYINDSRIINRYNLQY